MHRVWAHGSQTLKMFKFKQPLVKHAHHASIHVENTKEVERFETLISPSSRGNESDAFLKGNKPRDLYKWNCDY